MHEKNPETESIPKSLPSNNGAQNSRNDLQPSGGAAQSVVDSRLTPMSPIPVIPVRNTDVKPGLLEWFIALLPAISFVLIAYLAAAYANFHPFFFLAAIFYLWPLFFVFIGLIIFAIGYVRARHWTRTAAILIYSALLICIQCVAVFLYSEFMAASPYTQGMTFSSIVIPALVWLVSTALVVAGIVMLFTKRTKTYFQPSE